MKVLAIGDMHRKVNDARALIDFGLKNKYDKIVFVGDYADNFTGDANDTFALWDMLTKSPKHIQDKLVPLMGNHDYAYAHAIEMKMLYGGNNVQSGFDLMTLLKLDADYEKWLCEHLPLTAELDGVYYSHGGITRRWLDEKPDREEILAAKHPSRALAEIEYFFHSPYSPLWARPAYEPIEPTAKPTPYPRDMNQVFGHTPVTSCVNVHAGGNCWCIDTFSQYRNGGNIGDRSVLEIVDGKHFRAIPESEWHK